MNDLKPAPSTAPAAVSLAPHAIWGPGVKLMRNMQFAPRAALICMIFLIPLAWLTWSFYSSKNASIAFSAKERLGVEYNRTLFPLIDLAQQRRRDASSAASSGVVPTTLPDVQARLQAAQAELAGVDSRLGAQLGSAPAYARVQSAMAQTERSSGLDAVFQAHTDYIEALIALLLQVTDGSNLTLDPDIDTYYLMDAAFFRMPHVVESSGKLRGLGLAILRAGAITPQQQSLLSELIPIAEFQARNMREGLGKAVAYNPGLKESTDATQSSSETAAFFALARKAVITAQDYSPAFQAQYLRLSNATIENQYALNLRIVNELDRLIAARVAGLQAQRAGVTLVLGVGFLLAVYFSYTFFLVTWGGLRLVNQHEQQIEKMAFYDELTGLCNRRLLLDRLHLAQTSSTRNSQLYGLMLIDLDNFKDINDTRGHHIGDELLVQAAQRLKEATREGDTVARLGGDEFVVLLVSLGEEMEKAAQRASKRGQHILAALKRPYALSDGNYQCTSSIGITLFHEHNEGVDEILKRADLAMYQAKSCGRNAVRFFDPQIQSQVLARSQLEQELARAASQGQLLLYYQPVVNRHREVLGYEALVRWQHPAQGLVSPALFIPVAEQSGLILPIGRWVLQTACEQLAAWARIPEKAHLTLAVNMSAHQVGQADFYETVRDILRLTQAPPQRLKLELTESLLQHDVEQTIVKMQQITALGTTFSLDDFGTGYSSLSYLKRLPLSQLKIDQSFVRDLLTDPNDAVIARTILQLAQSLEMSVVAEGVETEGQRQALELMGCQAFQGYLFGRPAPLEQADPKTL